MATQKIHLHNAGLAEINGEIIAQGFLDVEGLKLLKIAPYQREVLKNAKTQKRNKLETALEEGGQFTNILLGMRGQRFHTNGTGLILEDPVYNVDEQQRVAAILSHIKRKPEDARRIKVGAEVRFATTEESERDLFHKANLHRTAMSPNVILRNIREEHPGLLTLWGLSNNEKDSPLYQRVQWQQRMGSHDLLSASTLSRTALTLHQSVKAAPKGALGLNQNTAGKSPLAIAGTLDYRASVIGLHAFRRNVVAFFELIDRTFGWRHLSSTTGATQTRGNFLFALASVLADHVEFWKGDLLKVPAMYRTSLKAFNLDDPNVQKLCGSSGTAADILYELLIRRLNKGRSANKLTKKKEAN